MNDPAYKLFIYGDLVGIVGPQGKRYGYHSPENGELLTKHMNAAFEAGRQFERSTNQLPVPGPPNPPRKIHPTEVA